MRRFRILGSLALLPALFADAAGAHSGKLAANGCHYESITGEYHCHQEVKPNRNVNAPVKKSRENVCHDRSSSNYKTIKYFIPYETVGESVTSGGRPAG
jgi:hypothetical protein